MTLKRYQSFDQWLVRDERTGCKNFTGCKVGAGYGRLRIGEKIILAHRHAYELENGPIPAGMLVCHKCDNPACCNHEHLFLGSQITNMQDRAGKGRYGTQAKGQSNGAAKLTDADIPAIRKLLAEGRRQKDIAEMYGVTQPLISMIALRKKWGHLP
ncbi:MAG: HNH endonuclease [Tabrizicola sp.]|jgi:hypothetical protein|nr:HNH endonuclease [Tabrizicola sp.]